MGRREDTRQRLFDAAITLIAERGYSSTTVDEIAAAAGVAKGTVYYNFTSKPELFTELLRHGIGALTTELRAAAEGLSGPDGVHAVATAQLRYIQRYQPFAQLLMAEMWRTNREWQPTLHALRDEAVTAIAEVIQRGVDAGEFDKRVDVRFGASALFGVVLAVALDWLVYSPDRSLEDVREDLLMIVDARLR
ncbi:TetR family transcriptional regulator [Longispora fulva]|uniref:AcrR family transcriptional regulator n=1 Tax=Longispora fulva TaxID=619741 RepID=A0A8J7KPI1_9ACTN|nr:TetR/AcrR family transcriptional regulator [Longispora fulva]MBG6141351.1 AcrR family transcriptional regulator [Longispora fulva]GIG59499.1 TetR family transcriptional regulator [Longispora fulva]